MTTQTTSPKVSVIVDTYNHARFIARAIDSVLEQTLDRRDLEIIIIDDGSDDGTDEIIRRRYKDAVAYIYQPNSGQASAFNTGFQAARGEYIALLDADDYWDQDKLKIVLDAFARFKADVVAHNLTIVGSNAAERVFFPYRSAGWLPGQLAPTSGMVFTRSVAGRLNPIPLVFTTSADLFMMCLIELAGWNVLFNCAPLGSYRLHDTNLYSGKATAAKVERQLATYLAMLDWLEDPKNIQQRAIPVAEAGIRALRMKTGLRSRVHEIRIRNGTSVQIVSEILQQLKSDPYDVRTLLRLMLLATSERAYRRIARTYHQIQTSRRPVISEH
jgi:hypothetical protein